MKRKDHVAGLRTASNEILCGETKLAGDRVRDRVFDTAALVALECLIAVAGQNDASSVLPIRGYASSDMIRNLLGPACRSVLMRFLLLSWPSTAEYRMMKLKIMRFLTC